MVREKNSILKDLKFEWSKLKSKEKGGNAEDFTQAAKDEAKKNINRLEKELQEIAPETKITDWDAKQREYEAKKNNSAPSENPKETASPYPIKTNMEDELDKFQFKEIKDSIDAKTNKIRKLFEEKVLIMKIAREYKLFGFDNVQSVGQILNVLNGA